MQKKKVKKRNLESFLAKEEEEERWVGKNCKGSKGFKGFLKVVEEVYWMQVKVLLL